MENSTRNSQDETGRFEIGRRELLTGAAMLGAAGLVGLPMSAGAQSSKAPADYHFGVSIPSSYNDALLHLIDGYKTGMAENGGGKMTIVEANFDVKKQADQIATLVSSGVDALLVLPTDPDGLSNAVQAAVGAGVPTFCTSAYVPGAAVVNTSMHDGFAMGRVSGQFLADKLGGKGKIGIITLPLNNSWEARNLGMQFVLRDYPDMEIVAEWPFDPTLKTTARDAVDGMLSAHPDLAAVWTAWDGAAIEATLAMRAAGRNDMIVTGIDGGRQAFEFIKSDSQFKMTVAQSFFQEAYYGVFFAHEHLAGRPVPRFVINSAYAVTHEDLADRELDEVDKYDQFGRPEELGWNRVG